MFVALGGMNLITNVIQVSARLPVAILYNVKNNTRTCVAIFDSIQYSQWTTIDEKGDVSLYIHRSVKMLNTGYFHNI